MGTLCASLSGSHDIRSDSARPDYSVWHARGMRIRSFVVDSGQRRQGKDNPCILSDDWEVAVPSL